MGTFLVFLKMESKRIFISDLPESIAQDQLESRFSKYGQVSSIEIKQRKELGPNQCPRFAYVNLVTDHRSLNQCFKDFSSNACAGHYLQLQIAKENFLERLKRERQEADQVSNKVELKTPAKREEDVDNGNPLYSQPAFKQNVHKTNGKTINEPEIVPKNKRIKTEKLDDFEEQSDIIIKNNKGKLWQSTLKIASTTQNSIAKPATDDPKKSDSDANIKRLQSLKNMKERYAAKKHLIQSGLSSGGKKPNQKIVFDDEADNNRTNRTTNGVKRPALFDDDDVEETDDFQANFDVKEQFEGPSGQKLLELQSRFKNDKRFNLDKRFIEDNSEEMEQEPDEKDDDDDADLEAEKYDQLKILEDVLGTKIIKKSNREENFTRKTMLKYDPTRPEHSSLILKPDADLAKSNEKVKKKGSDECKEPEPEVSKEVFYKVPESLKNAFEGNNGQFSLLSAFGKPEKIEEENAEEVPAKTIKTTLPNYASHNPFKHDSSDEENEAEDIPHKDTAEPSGPKSDLQQNPLRSSQSVFWTEPFFFKIDDFRLQEGFDFIEKMKVSEKEFVSVRRQVKEIVKSKVRNNERKIKMFKKKLGGTKKRKHIRMKKALKR